MGKWCSKWCKSNLIFFINHLNNSAKDCNVINLIDSISKYLTKNSQLPSNFSSYFLAHE